MGLHFSELTLVDFPEFAFSDFTQTETTDIEITAEGLGCNPDFTIEGQVSMKNYCSALLQKTVDLPHRRWDTFLAWQCDHVKKPFVWLQRFEVLLVLNESLLLRHNFSDKYKTARAHIERARRAIWQSISEELEGTITELYHIHFNIHEVKEQLKLLPDFADKYAYLLEAKTGYLQNKPTFSITTIVPFDVQIDLEIEKLRQLEELISTSLPPQLPPPNEEAPASKIKINLSVAELAYFFRAMYDLDLIPRQYKTEVCKFIAASFQTKQSGDISWRSVKNHFDAPMPKAVDTCYEKFVHLMQKAKKDLGK